MICILLLFVNYPNLIKAAESLEKIGLDNKYLPDSSFYRLQHQFEEDKKLETTTNSIKEKKIEITNNFPNQINPSISDKIKNFIIEQYNIAAPVVQETYIKGQQSVTSFYSKIVLPNSFYFSIGAAFLSAILLIYLLKSIFFKSEKESKSSYNQSSNYLPDFENLTNNSEIICLTGRKSKKPKGEIDYGSVFKPKEEKKQKQSIENFNKLTENALFDYTNKVNKEEELKSFYVSYMNNFNNNNPPVLQSQKSFKNNNDLPIHVVQVSYDIGCGESNNNEYDLISAFKPVDIKKPTEFFFSNNTSIIQNKENNEEKISEILNNLNKDINKNSHDDFMDFFAVTPQNPEISKKQDFVSEILDLSSNSIKSEKRNSYHLKKEYLPPLEQIKEADSHKESEDFNDSLLSHSNEEVENEDRVVRKLKKMNLKRCMIKVPEKGK